MRRRSASPLGDFAGNTVLVGAVAVVIVIVGVFLSYNANEGLPFVPSYKVSAEVPDAAELVAGDEVRIGGARVGRVKTVEAVPRRGARPAHARLELALDVAQQPLPLDTRAQVRPRSILGSKYLALTPGHARRGIPPGGTLPLSRAVGVVELDEAIGAFDARTKVLVRGALHGLGDALAGRGRSVNEAIASTRRLLPPAERILAVLAAPRTDLPGLVDGLAAATGALAPVAPQLGSLVDHAAVTLDALDSTGSALGQTLEQLPPTEAVGTRALGRIGPVLGDAAAIATGLRPAARLLPGTARSLAGALDAAVPVLRDTTGRTLGATLASLERFARNPAALGSARRLLSATGTLRTFLTFLAPAQTVCNVFGAWARNIVSVGSEGDANGSWIRLVPLVGSDQVYQQSTPDADLHLNFYPRADATECESGNERYVPGRAIGNPPGSQGTAHADTAPGAGR
ncbi:MAG: phospholipid/cholesterol/gamma-HCH transport system substrate-binding protein [Solirubrobacteraceae bacterium]|jgi:virulence factor Mce-like protein|nr:phospholipid/cholesterol/gamma-HCH transport system substrate-binding protein [Solirubrobacteraceae bacterium]